MTKTPGTRGPKSDDTIAKIATLSRDWREDAEQTLLDLQRELRARASSLETMELIGAIRVLGEALTTSRALIPDAVDTKDRDAA